jgi:hypothetical protein
MHKMILYKDAAWNTNMEIWIVEEGTLVRVMAEKRKIMEDRYLI